MSLELRSPCKINLLLNILGRRSDGFHALETVLQPLGLWDRLEMNKGGLGVQLTCTDSKLLVDTSNLVHRAALAFLAEAGISEGVRIHLVKRLPLSAGLGGGSANAAVTLSGLNRLFDQAVSSETLARIAAKLGSDIPFFLQDRPAIGTGRGEQIHPVDPFEALDGVAVLLVRPGFGVSTAWAYEHLAKYPESLNGRTGRASELAERLRAADLTSAREGFFNSLEAPVFDKYPLLAVLKEYLLDEGATVALMSGSGSTTFALTHNVSSAESLREKVLGRFGVMGWTAVATL